MRNLITVYVMQRQNYLGKIMNDFFFSEGLIVLNSFLNDGLKVAIGGILRDNAKFLINNEFFNEFNHQRVLYLL